MSCVVNRSHMQWLASVPLHQVLRDYLCEVWVSASPLHVPHCSQATICLSTVDASNCLVFCRALASQSPSSAMCCSPLKFQLKLACSWQIPNGSIHSTLPSWWFLREFSGFHYPQPKGWVTGPRGWMTHTLCVHHLRCEKNPTTALPEAELSWHSKHGSSCWEMGHYRFRVLVVDVLGLRHVLRLSSVVLMRPGHCRVFLEPPSHHMDTTKVCEEKPIGHRISQTG